MDYQRIHASSSELASKLQHFLAAGGHGANITLPHKQAVMALCTDISARARRAAAVNTLLRSDDGWRGDNTDGLGLVLDLSDQAIKLDAASVLIIGAGGATRGIVPALLDAGCKRIVIANRTPDKAHALIDAINDTRLTASALQRDYGATFDLLIHATAAGHEQHNLPLPDVLQGRLTVMISAMLTPAERFSTGPNSRVVATATAWACWWRRLPNRFACGPAQPSMLHSAWRRRHNCKQAETAFHMTIEKHVARMRMDQVRYDHVTVNCDPWRHQRDKK